MRKYNVSNYVYTKLRKTFGRQPLFQAVPAQMLDSIYPDVSLQKEYTLRNPVNKEIQATLPQSEHDGNTKQITYHDQGIDHTEGGWPRDVHLYNEEHVARHRRRVQHEDGYIHSVLSLDDQMKHYINQNNAIEMYETYFSDMASQSPVEKYKIQIQNVYRDPFDRPLSCIEWTNEKKSRIVASYSYKSYPNEKEDARSNKVCFMWDVHVETAPIYEFTPKYGCWQVACAPVDPEIIIAGLDKGIINVFDTRSRGTAASSSSLYNSHRGPITALLYSHSRTNTEFFSGSTDGQCLWWDIRNLSQPIDQLTMSVRMGPDESPNLGNAEGLSTLEFDRGFPTKFLAGTESGLIINANRMGRTHSEILSSYWDAHSGPVKAVHRSSCTSRMFISCGDWSVRVWSEEVRTAPIIVTRPYRYRVTDVAWSPTRYSSYMVISEDGIFYYWDLLRRHREAIATLQVSKNGLNKITPHPTGMSFAVGDNKGCIFLLHLSENMTIPGTNDKQLMHQTYDRETRREHILDTRVKEMRLKVKGEEELLIMPEDDIEEDLAKETDNYFNIVNEQIRQTDGIFTTGNVNIIEK